ncbi:hypothetical protein ABZ619_08245 [Streptomyces sp. NPDC007851]|uniref:hypothetical protein n=1 Tax=Streptomyces sp. NPDC007851 TaxID=3155008 RepID=UPI0033E7A288
MRWWAGGYAIAAVVALAACGTSGAGADAGGPSGGGGAGGGPSTSPSAGSSAGAPGATSAPPSSGVSSAGPAPASPSRPAVPSAGGCAAGRAEVSVVPGDAVRRQVCVRPGTVVSLVLRPRTDDRRWTGVASSAPALVLVSGWRVDPDGTAHASLRSAGTRGGGARVTASAKAPDVAGAARAAFTLDVTVTPYPREG